MKYLYYILSFAVFLSLYSCCKERDIRFEGRLVDGITGNPIPDQTLLVEYKISSFKSVSNCIEVEEKSITNSNGIFFFDFIQEKSSDLFIENSTHTPDFAVGQLRVTDLDNNFVWKNDLERNTVSNPEVPNNRDLDTEVIVEWLPTLILSPKKVTDSTMVINRITIPSLDQSYGLDFSNRLVFLNKLDNTIPITLLYKDGSTVDSVYTYDARVGNGILTITY